MTTFKVAHTSLIGASCIWIRRVRGIAANMTGCFIMSMQAPSVTGLVSTVLAYVRGAGNKVILLDPPTLVPFFSKPVPRRVYSPKWK
jgi:hypothetical protein